MIEYIRKLFTRDNYLKYSSSKLDSTMDLKNFVYQTLTEIIESVAEAQSKVKDFGTEINPGGLRYNFVNLSHQGYTEDGKIS